MPKWTYLLTFDGIISETSSKSSDATDPVPNDTLLLWDSEQKRLVAWGTPMWWVPHSMIRDVIVKSGNDIRVRLYRSPMSSDYGFHLDISPSLFSNITHDAELALSRMISIWESNMFISQVPPIFLDNSIPRFSPGSVRTCRLKLTSHQQRALDWMLSLESIVDQHMLVKTGIPVPGTDLTFSFRKRLFVKNTDTHFQALKVNSGVLGGFRGTGKSVIIRELLKMPFPFLPSPTCQEYAYRSNLLVVPDHLFEQWKQGLSNFEGGVELVDTPEVAKQWRVLSTPPRVVLVSLSAIMAEIYTNIQKYQDSMEDYVARRKSLRDRSMISVTWDRVVVDEFLNHTGIPAAVKFISCHFLWAIQGGATPREEGEIIESLYDPETLSGDILSTMVYNKLPLVVPFQPRNETRVYLTANEEESKLRDFLGDSVSESWGVYTHYDTKMFTKCSSWEEVLALSPPVFEKMGDSDSDSDTTTTGFEDDSWLYPNNFNNDINVTFTVNGVDVNIPLNGGGDEDDEDDEDYEEGDEENEPMSISNFIQMLANPTNTNQEEEEEEEDEDDDEEEELEEGEIVDDMEIEGEDDDDEVEEVVASQTYFNDQVSRIIQGQSPPTCAICLETECNTIICCGHMLCFVCAARIIHKSDAQCPQCRYKISKRQMFMVGNTFESTSVSWLKREVASFNPRDGCLLIVGDNKVGISHLKKQLPDSVRIVCSGEIAGLVDTNVGKCILLDDSVCIPDTLSNSHNKVVDVVRLSVRFGV